MISRYPRYCIFSATRKLIPYTINYLFLGRVIPIAHAFIGRTNPKHLLIIIKYGTNHL